MKQYHETVFLHFPEQTIRHSSIMRALGIILCSSLCIYVAIFHVTALFAQRQEDGDIITPSVKDYAKPSSVVL